MITYNTFDDYLFVPRKGIVRSRDEVSLQSNLFRTNYDGLDTHFILQLPIVSANMDTVTEEEMAKAMRLEHGMGVIHRGMDIDNQSHMVRYLTKVKRCAVGAAVGVTGDYKDRVSALAAAGATFLVIDIAHGHSVMMEDAVNYIRRYYRIPIIAGNVCTADGAKFLMDLGVDAIKVGVGAGSVCRTRLETGMGMPQLTAIRTAYHATRGKIPIIADGGIRHDKDIFMSLAAGASTVMLGGMLAGTDETPGPLLADEKGRYKFYRGMASREAQLNRDEYKGAPEGETIRIEHKGSVTDVMDRITGHLRSAISYAGCKSVLQLHEEVTPVFEEHIAHLSVGSIRESYEGRKK